MCSIQRAFIVTRSKIGFIRYKKILVEISTMGMDCEHNDKIITRNRITVVEINEITYTPIGKFRKSADEVIDIIEKRLNEIQEKDLKPPFDLGLELLKREMVENVIIEEKRVVFQFQSASISVER